jgi:hypothetical protein
LERHYLNFGSVSEIMHDGAIDVKNRCDFCLAIFQDVRDLKKIIFCLTASSNEQLASLYKVSVASKQLQTW